MKQLRKSFTFIKVDALLSYYFHKSLKYIISIGFKLDSSFFYAFINPSKTIATSNYSTTIPNINKYVIINKIAILLPHPLIPIFSYIMKN